MHVASVGYAAVKGTRHVARPHVVLGPAGPEGDRRWCLVDVAARQVLRTVAHPTLMTISVPDLDGPGPAPEPTGEQLTCDYWGRPVALDLVAHPLAEEASALLGHPVRLAAAQPGEVVYAGSVSLLSLATLAQLPSPGVPGAPPDPRRFRATVVLDGLPARAEEDWLGREVRIGEAVVRPTARTVRCRVVEHDPESGVRDLSLLRSLPLVDGQPVCGVDGVVVTPGVVRPGDPVAPA